MGLVSVVNQTRYAFTVIELLIVLAIISLLAGLIFSTLNCARGSARSIVCRNNLRQLGVGAALYSSDTGRLPVILGWLYAYSTAKDDWEAKDVSSGQLYPYVGERRSYMCPSERFVPLSHSGKTSGAANDHSYAMNCMMCHTHDLSTCLTPAKSLFFIERTNLSNDTIGGLLADSPHLELYHLVSQIPFCHKQRAWMLMIDLHVESQTRKGYETGSATAEFWYPGGDSSLKGAP